MQLGIAAFKAAGKDYKVHAFLEDAAHIVPDLIDAIDEIEEKAQNKEPKHGSAFDSTMSYEDLEIADF